ncbi:hypothetical protein HU200_020947 [Digitaria exilis]|uniref:GRAS family transcription factor n=1 Tax=Digitaria exilis TaxID=1010633 RepID=A0A835F0R5_9POAL|nr:hypothetical protein HU200_020947 [Digitaria exilis]
MAAASSDDLGSGEPFSPSVFLDLPPTPHSHGEEAEDPALPPADLVFPVISRMLMEDDTSEDGELLRQFPADHPSLLQAQLPFAQILSDTTTATALSSQAAAAAATNGSGAGTLSLPVSPSLCPAAFENAIWPYDPEELSRVLLSRTCRPALGVVGLDGFTAGDGIRRSSDEDGAENTVITAAPAEDGSSFFSSSGQDRVNMDMLNMAFLKGMEEAKKFLPTMNDNLLPSRVEEGSVLDLDGINPLPQSTRGNGSRGQKKCPSSWSDLEAEAGRKSKIMAPEPEENGEAVDKMIINSCMDKMKDLRIARISDAEKKKITRKQSSSNEPVVVDLCTLLIHCAQAMSMEGNHNTTTELLRQIRRRASPTGDATQRLAHYFANGLETRLAGSGRHVYRSLVSKHTSVVEYLKAYHLYLTACCFETMAYKFSGMNICNAAALAGRLKKKKVVHIVDYGVGYGFQWPSLLAYMATWEGGPPAVRLTGVDLPRPGFRPSSRTEATGRRLTSFARDLGVPFEFRTVVAEWDTVRAHDLAIDPDEVLVVSSITGLGTTMDEFAGAGDDVDGPSPRDVILGNIREMRPDVFVLCAVNGSYGGPLFVSRFREALFHYSAVFDMIDGGGAAAVMDEGQRMVVERDLVGRCALNVIACEGLDRVERPETYRQWQTRCQRVGLRQLPLCMEIVKRLREKVKKYYHKEFVVDVDHEWVLQGWKGRILYAMSTWTADDDTASSNR